MKRPPAKAPRAPICPPPLRCEDHGRIIEAENGFVCPACQRAEDWTVALVFLIPVGVVAVTALVLALLGGGR